MNAPAITVHDYEQAHAAFAAAAALECPLCLLSPEGAAGYLGVNWLSALADELRAAFPRAAVTAVLDCADDAGYAMAAIRQGAADTLIFTGPRGIHVRIAEIGADAGIEVLRKRPRSLDLASVEIAETACRAWLESGGAGRRAGN